MRRVPAVCPPQITSQSEGIDPEHFLQLVASEPDASGSDDVSPQDLGIFCGSDQPMCLGMTGVACQDATGGCIDAPVGEVYEAGPFSSGRKIHDEATSANEIAVLYEDEEEH